jgi:hypothetical protein
VQRTTTGSFGTEGSPPMKIVVLVKPVPDTFGDRARTL